MTDFISYASLCGVTAFHSEMSGEQAFKAVHKQCIGLNL